MFSSELLKLVFLAPREGLFLLWSHNVTLFHHCSWRLYSLLPEQVYLCSRSIVQLCIFHGLYSLYSLLPEKVYLCSGSRLKLHILPISWAYIPCSKSRVMFSPGAYLLQIFFIALGDHILCSLSRFILLWEQIVALFSSFLMELVLLHGPRAVAHCSSSFLIFLYF